ncbi:MAG: hypothetical protein JW958_00020 [Candidatus Eisenbacteria bacterium]|nr:hypothetical protein [Candidatus Eisenbacteria bacterium]
MRRRTLSSPALLLLVVLALSVFVVGVAHAQFERADLSKPVVITNTDNTPHGGGDPDNPVPVLGQEQMAMGAEEIDYHEELYGLPADRRSFGPLVSFARLVKGAVASMLL